ncbi:MAG: GNAT family N-acetyltransferase [Anaerolineae bacterium]|nr:GNAT family N-acetyltransferase [Anaerolineae bacterium]
MFNIRPMSPDDWEMVSHLDALAFRAYYEKTGREIPVRRTRANIHASLAMNPSGCFVAEDDTVVGYVFSRFWGQAGWIGTFGVDPDHHGKGTGQKLLMEVIGGLKKAGCTTIGLETMPDSPHNVGLYTRIGFNPSYPTLYLTNSPAALSSTLPFTLFDQVEEREGLSHITALSRAASRDLDYTMEARNAKDYGWGDTLLVGWPQPWAFAIIRTVSSREGASDPICEVTSLVVEPGSRERLGEVLQLLQPYAQQKQVGQITLPVNAIDSSALQEAMKNGFRVGRVLLRLVYQGECIRPEGIVMSRWIM